MVLGLSELWPFTACLQGGFMIDMAMASWLTWNFETQGYQINFKLTLHLYELQSVRRSSSQPKKGLRRHVRGHVTAGQN